MKSILEEILYELSSRQLNDAIKYNQKYASSLGWANYFDAIVAKVLRLNYSPTEWAFAEAVAEWQAKNGLTNDGKIGPSTWAKMQEVITGRSPAQGGQSDVQNIIDTNRHSFGVSAEDERIAATFYGGNSTLRAINVRNINSFLPNLRSKTSHFNYSMGLYSRTSLSGYNSGRDLPIILALATRESGSTVFRTDNTFVVSAGRDTHPQGVSGLDYLYNLSRYFREAGLPIYKVSTSELLPNRKNRKPGKIQAKHLLFSHMIKSGSDEKVFSRRHIKLALDEYRLKNDPAQLFSHLNKSARRTWMALYYSGSGHLYNSLKDLVKYQNRSGREIDLNGVLDVPSSIFGRRSRVILARATSLRALVFETLGL